MHTIASGPVTAPVNRPGGWRPWALGLWLSVFPLAAVAADGPAPAGTIDVLATHDRIVRSALAGHGGREVKHTGDGIMAFFPCAARAVECGLAIQDSISAYNEHRPLREPLRVAIGINTGSPIRDHGDLYGRAVIVAARAVEIAGGGRVVVTDVVRQLAAGRRISFEVIPGVSLAGFAEAPTVYRAVRTPTVLRPDSGEAL